MTSLPRGGILVVLIALFGTGGACNGHTSGTGSETNWLLGCTKDSDCAQGHCTCGMCTSKCTSSDQCGGPGVACVGPGTTSFSAVCGDVVDPPQGLCLYRCGNDSPCPGGFGCLGGTCVPATGLPLDIGAPCIPEPESNPDFSAFSGTDVNIDSKFSGCTTALCLAYYFRGRVTCPYGQPADPTDPSLADTSHQICFTPDGLPVTVPVEPQLSHRRPSDAVYCSCHCDGPAGTGPFCACPEGFECTKVIPDLGFPGSELAGSYCVKAGTEVADPTQLATTAGPPCSEALHNCDTQGP